MDSKDIEQLLERYWNCETSLEEEQQLRDYFQSGSVPAHLKETAELFRFFGNQRRQSTSPSFEKEIVGKIGREPRGKSVKLMSNILRIAAGLVVVVAATYLVRQEIRRNHPQEDTYNDPKMAFEETKKALMMISKGFGKGQKEANKINIFNEAEQKVGGKEKKKESI